MRKSPKVTLSLPPAILADLDAIASEDAQGRDPNRSAAVVSLVLAEKRRRARRAEKKNEGTETTP